MLNTSACVAIERVSMTCDAVWIIKQESGAVLSTLTCVAIERVSMTCDAVWIIK